MKQSRAAMVIMEILISMVIIFLAIFLVSATIQRFNQVNLQNRAYQELYITFLSLLDSIDNTTCSHQTRGGILNNFNYNFSCTDVQDFKTGRNANIVTLQRILIKLKKGNMEKEFIHYHTSSTENRIDHQQ